MKTEPSANQLSQATEAVRKALNHENAATFLCQYYDPASGYAGSTFLDLAPNDPHEITATDLYALSLLDVRAMPLAGCRLLEPGGHRDRVLAALSSADLPASADLLAATDATFDAARTLYLTVRTTLGRNPWVTASKLCARKRPYFFPVRDSVVTQLVLRLGQHYLVEWKVYQHLLADQELEGVRERRHLVGRRLGEDRRPARPAPSHGAGTPANRGRSQVCHHPATRLRRSQPHQDRGGVAPAGGS